MAELMSSGSVDVHAPERLCDRCAQLDFLSLSDIGKHNSYKLFHHGVIVQELGPVSNWDVTGCVVCRFFEKFKYDTGKSGDGERGEAWHLRAFSSTCFFSNLLYQSWCEPTAFVLFGVLNGPLPWTTTSNAIHRDSLPVRWSRPPDKLFATIRDKDMETTAPFALKHVDPRRIDYERIRQWIRNNHKQDTGCSDDQVSTTTGLKLIDCETRDVVHAEEVAYVALSYVWGQGASRLSRSLEEAPQVVQDAIVVTRELNYRYLWVDQYCIDQGNSEEKHTQIAQMDKIYADASLTIIAAAGTDADYGLPGVSVRPRAILDEVSIGDLTLRSTAAYPRALVESSTWSSRGWTFQEALLSKRNLFFTEEQVFFECPCFSSCESVNTEFEMSSALTFILRPQLRTETLFRYFTQDLTESLDGYTGTWDSFVSFAQLVARYRTRELSHEEDTLNAILGILKVFGSASDPLYHLYGIPFLQGDSRLTLHDYLAATLGWKEWAGRRPLQHLPSWTWAAWSNNGTRSIVADGLVSWRSNSLWDDKLPYIYARPGGYPFPLFYFLRGASERIPLSNYTNGDLQEAGTASRLPQLCIESYVITVPVAFHGANGEPFPKEVAEYPATGESLDQPIVVDDLAATELELSKDEVKEVDALVLSRYKDDSFTLVPNPSFQPPSNKFQEISWAGNYIRGDPEDVFLEVMLVKYVEKSTVRRVSVFRLRVAVDSAFHQTLKQRRVDLKLV